LERAARLAPGDPTIHYITGLAYLRMGETARARRELRRIAQFETGNPMAFAALGDVAARENRSDEATVHFNRAVTLLRAWWRAMPVGPAQPEPPGDVDTPEDEDSGGIEHLF
jgi:predicted Zn-dependent protease